MGFKLMVGWWMGAALSVASLTAAGADLRLVEAAKNQNKAAIRALIGQRVDVNTPQPDGATALHWAVYWDDLETAALLIRAGAQVNAANDYGVTPLSLAATNGNAGLVSKLLEAGANPNAALSTGETVLMTAARSGQVEAVTHLLARGAEVNRKDTEHGQTALMWAVSEKHLDVARTLIAHGADIHAHSATKNGFTPLLFAAREGDIEGVRMLLAAGATVNETATDGSDSLLVATVRGHAALVSFLLDQGADPNAIGAGYTPLHWAVGVWETNLTGEERGIQVPQTGEWSALDGLQGPAKLAVINALMSHGANPNVRATKNPPRFGGGGGPNFVGATPFLVAAAAADVPLMRLLLDAGADPTVTTNQQVTPLIAAAGMNRNMDSRVKGVAADAVRFLVERGADVNAANNVGDTALHIAGAMGADAVAQILIEHGANMNAKNKKGWTPLTYATGYYVNATFQINKSTADLLRKAGAPENPLDCSIVANLDATDCREGLKK